MNEVSSISRKSKYLNMPDVDEMHLDSKNWLSQIAFWKDELEFLKSLPLRYGAKIDDQSKVLRLKYLTGKLNGDLTMELEYLESKVKSLEAMLVGLVQNSFVSDEQMCRKEHKLLNAGVEQFKNEYELIKMDLSKILKVVLKK